MCAGNSLDGNSVGVGMAGKKKSDKKHIVGVDIGTTKIVCLIGEQHEDQGLNVIGFGQHPSVGLKRGVVVNIESTVNSIQQAVEAAEVMVGCPVGQVYTGVAGSHIKSINSHGIVAISETEVTQSDIDRVIDAARAVAIPADQKILHILPQEFIIDQQDGIKEPIGMSGVRLEAKVHIVTGAVSSAQNIIKSVKQCALEPLDMIVEQLASSYAVLTQDEKELGVCMVDIGGGTTDIAIYTGGAIRHTAVIPIAGDQVTNDIAVAFRTPVRYAEQVKLDAACCLAELASNDRQIEISSMSNRPSSMITEFALAQVVQPRYEELFSLVQAELRRSGFEDLIPAGIVLTGGASCVHCAVELATRVFRMPVRIGAPTQVRGIEEITHNPSYATAVGLLQYGMGQSGSVFEQRAAFKHTNKNLFGRMRGWLQTNL
jgi:cell division protein FtsA